MVWANTPVVNISSGRGWLRDPDSSSSDPKLADEIGMDNFATVAYLGDNGPQPGDCILVEIAAGMAPGEAVRHW